jgi:hypothetical protein
MQETAPTQEMTLAQERVDADSQRGSLWFIFLAGPVVYIAYFLVVWAIGEFGCLAGIQQLSFLGANPIRLGVVVLTAIAALVTLITGIVGFRRWRHLRQGPHDPDEDDPKFMLFVGTWLNGLFTAVILLSAVPMLLGSTCAWL